LLDLRAERALSPQPRKRRAGLPGLLAKTEGLRLLR